MSALQPGVDVHDRPGDEFLLVQLEPRQHGAKRTHKVAPDMGDIRDLRDNADGDQLRLHDLEALLQQSLALPAGGVVIKEDVKRVFVPVLRVYAVGGEAAAQAVGAVMHGDHTLNNSFAAHPRPLPGDDRRDRAPGGDAHLSFQFHTVSVLS